MCSGREENQGTPDIKAPDSFKRNKERNQRRSQKIEEDSQRNVRKLLNICSLLSRRPESVPVVSNPGSVPAQPY